MLTSEELAAFISYKPESLEDADQKIQQLLQHIAEIQIDTRVAYEVIEVSGTFNWRENYGLFWVREAADKLKIRLVDFFRQRGRTRLAVSRVNIANINGRWHKFNVTPYESVPDGFTDATKSRIETKSLVKTVKLEGFDYES